MNTILETGMGMPNIVFNILDIRTADDSGEDGGVLFLFCCLFAVVLFLFCFLLGLLFFVCICFLLFCFVVVFGGLGLNTKVFYS